jgi:hypothetical protein
MRKAHDYDELEKRRGPMDTKEGNIWSGFIPSSIYTMSLSAIVGILPSLITYLIFHKRINSFWLGTDLATKRRLFKAGQRIAILFLFAFALMYCVTLMILQL